MWDAYLRTLPPPRLREHGAALGRHRDGLAWQATLRRYLDREYGARMAEAAVPPKTDIPPDPGLDALFDQLMTPKRK